MKKIDSLMYNPGTAGYYTDDFRRVLEDHLTLLKNDQSTNGVVLEPHTAYKYVGDFYGALQVLGVAEELYWITMRINGLTSTTDKFDHLQVVLTPNQKMIQKIWASHNSTRRVKN
jgi:hypothetical protein